MCHAEVMKMNDNKMWALVKEKPEQGLWLKRVQIPEVGPNDVKIKIHKNAICGTDVHIYQWNEWAQHTIPIGLTAGHEYVGEVVEVGAGVQGFKVGDLVSGEGHITCGKCRNCLEGHKENCKDAKGVGVNRNGAFAEYLVIPASNVWPCRLFFIPCNLNFFPLKKCAFSIISCYAVCLQKLFYSLNKLSGCLLLIFQYFFKIISNI